MEDLDEMDVCVFFEFFDDFCGGVLLCDYKFCWFDE